MRIIKVGGGEGMNIEGIARDVARMDDKVVIVHGANHARDELMQQLGLKKKILRSVSGYSSVYSDDTLLDMIMMAYAGLMNKRIVQALQIEGVNAIGLSGIDGRLIRGRRNRGIRIREGDKVKLIRDRSGKPQSVNTGLLKTLMEDHVPVISIPIIDENGHAINSENDDIIRVLKEALRAEEVIQLIGAPGLLEDKDDPDSLIRNLDAKELEVMEKKVKGRMKRKILALRKMLEGRDCTVWIKDGRIESPILTEGGTRIR